MKTRFGFVLCAVCFAGSTLSRADQPAFGSLESPSLAQVQVQAKAWLKEIGKTDPATLRQFEALWNRKDRPVLDLVADTLALASPEAARLLAEARNPLAPAPLGVPEILKNAKAAPFLQNNLALAYARALSLRRVHEEALDVFKITAAEKGVDPAGYFFHRAVCEHALLQKKEAGRTIARLLEEASDAPERFRTVAVLMLLDMQTWKDKDLAAVARKMENIERRLDLARGGPQTQKLQKEVIHRLDELIKELENQANQKNPSDGPPKEGQPKQGQNPNNNPTNPLERPQLGGPGGSGRVDPARVQRLREQWGHLPERQKIHALQELTRGMSPRYREAIENYFRKLTESPRP